MTDARVVTRLASVLFVLLAGASLVFAQDPPTPRTDRTDAVRVFLDCNRCDEDFLRREIAVVNYVRNREDADVHVLVTTQPTGGGGTEYTLRLIGLGRFAGGDQTLKYIAPQTATSDEERKGFAEILKRGLVRYVAETPLADRMTITFSAPPDEAAAKVRDPWNLWVFRTSFGGSLNGEQSNTGHSIRASASANRTTDDWKLSVSTSGSYRKSRFELSETESFTSISRSFDGSALAVKSLTDHWSAGLVGSASSSTFLNYDLRTRLATGVEYNVFPYSQSTRRMLTVQYTVGGNTFDYKEETIFGKTSERLLDHRLESSFSMRQPWGSGFAEVSFSQFLNKPDKYNISVFGNADVRLFKGLSFGVFANAARTRDQLYLPRAGATPEEILVRQRQLLTGYRYSLNVNVSYSFGSIFNNVVNPRFGGGGDFFFFF